MASSIQSTNSSNSHEMTLKEFKLALIEFGRTCIPQQYQDILEIPDTSIENYMYLRTVERHEIIDFIDINFNRSSITVQLSNNIDISTLKVLKAFQFLQEYNDRLASVSFGNKDIEKVLDEEKANLKNNIKKVLSERNSIIREFLELYIDQNNKTGKIYRLSQVARKLNVNYRTVVDFFKEKGIEIDGSPNTKISQAMFDEISQEFAGVKSQNQDLTGEDIRVGLKIQDLLQDKTRKYFVAGYHWNDESQLDKFINDGRWENGNENKVTTGVNSAKKGDVLFAKTTWVKGKSTGILTLRAVGVVTHNHQDGHNLDVNWHLFSKQIDLKVGSHYRYTFQLIRENYLLEILNEVLLSVPNLPELIESLSRAIGDTINLQGLKSTAKNYWWFYPSDKWAIESLSVGQTSVYRFADTKGEHLQAEIGDLVIGFQSNPNNEIVGLLRIKNIDEVGQFIFELVYEFKDKTKLDELKNAPGFKEVNFFNYSIKPFLRLERDLFDAIIQTTELGDLKVKKEEKSKDKIPFHYDRVVEDDKLGREPAAVAFSNLIKDDIFTQDLDHAFMVHLQGEWGAGKSTFLNLIKNQLNTGDKKWVIVNYNAWKNQHLDPPWWTFLDQIFQQAKTDENFTNKRRLKVCERYRRIKYYTAWQKVLALALTVVFIGLLLYFGNTILDLAVNLFASEKIDGETKGLTVDVFAKLIISIGSLVGLLYSISKFLTTPFFLTSSKDATSFMERTSDPLKRIKDHFKNLVADINRKHQLAIFIDDIDRCDRKFLVELLEGIQTLFKEEKVLYIVAGDKQWISKAFQNQYKEFDTERETGQNHVGDLFIRKAFQLSIRMPQVSDTKKKMFWDHILGVKDGGDNESREINELDHSERTEFEKEIASVSDEETVKPEELDRIEKQFKISADEVSKRVIERKNATNKEFKHLLLDFHHLLDANPRSIIRLANFYTMTRSTLIAERRNTRPNLLFRWLILKESYPSALRIIGEVKDMKEFKGKLDKSDLSSELKSKCTFLIDGEKEQDKLTIEIIKELEGL